MTLYRVTIADEKAKSAIVSLFEKGIEFNN